jgi:hypothetical protein
MRTPLSYEAAERLELQYREFLASLDLATGQVETVSRRLLNDAEAAGEDKTGGPARRNG